MLRSPGRKCFQAITGLWQFARLRAACRTRKRWPSSCAAAWADGGLGASVGGSASVTEIPSRLRPSVFTSSAVTSPSSCGVDRWGTDGLCWAAAPLATAVSSGSQFAATASAAMHRLRCAYTMTHQLEIEYVLQASRRLSGRSCKPSMLQMIVNDRFRNAETSLEHVQSTPSAHTPAAVLSPHWHSSGKLCIRSSSRQSAGCCANAAIAGDLRIVYVHQICGLLAPLRLQRRPSVAYPAGTETLIRPQASSSYPRAPGSCRQAPPGRRQWRQQQRGRALAAGPAADCGGRRPLRRLSQEDKEPPRPGGGRPRHACAPAPPPLQVPFRCQPVQRTLATP